MQVSVLLRIVRVIHVALVVVLFMLALAWWPVVSAAAADRIDTMRATGEIVCYTARLRAAGAHFREQGVPLERIPIHWHGDETAQERAFVLRTVSEGYMSIRDDGRPVSAYEHVRGAGCFQ